MYLLVTDEAIKHFLSLLSQKVLQSPFWIAPTSKDTSSILTVCFYCKLFSVSRDRPAAIAVEVKSIDDTSNFDEFPDADLKWRKFKHFSRYIFTASVYVFKHHS